jgi:two-component system nitrate/nitrite response regulator NarL
MKARPSRVAVLFDRHPLWLEAVERVLNGLDIEVAGKALGTEEALELVREHRPDVLVGEVNGSNGTLDALELIRSARTVDPGLKVIVLSASDDPQRINAAFSFGAVAYVVKTAHPDDLASAVRQELARSNFIPDTQTPVRVPPARDEEPEGESPMLTRREHEILQLVAEGYSNAELARMLWVTEQTVKFHLSNIYRKLDVPNRTGASRWAQVNGLLSSKPVAQAAL